METIVIGKLDRYVLREFLAYFAMSIFLFLGLFVVVDLFEKLDKFVDNAASSRDVALYYLYGLPYIFVLITPLSMLLASLLCLGQISRRGELVAMLSAGVSFIRILSPLLVFATGVAFASYALAEHVMPAASVAQDRLYEEKIRSGQKPRASRQRNVTYMGRGDRLFYVKTVDSGRRMLRDVVMQEFDPARRLRERVDAREAVYENGLWRFRSGYLRRGVTSETLAATDSSAGEQVVAFASYWRSDIAETPEDFLRRDPAPDEMGRAGLSAYIQRLRESRARTRKFEVEYHLKLAVPLVNLIIVLLGTSVAARLRRPGLAQGFGLSIFIGFAYIAFVRAGQAIGYNGLLPPFVAAWLGNAVFFGIAVVLQLRLHR